jgi:predicted transcriptional regulator
MRTLKVGIASYEEMKQRTLAIARGKLRPSPQEPKVWFTSTESMAKILSAKNRELLRMIRESGPQSLTELAEKTGRKKSNLSRTIHSMERYGLVSLHHNQRKIVPRVKYDRLYVVMDLTA